MDSLLPYSEQHLMSMRRVLPSLLMASRAPAALMFPAYPRKDPKMPFTMPGPCPTCHAHMNYIQYRPTRIVHLYCILDVTLTPPRIQQNGATREDASHTR